VQDQRDKRRCSRKLQKIQTAVFVRHVKDGNADMMVGLEFVWNILLTIIFIPTAWVLVYLNGRVNELYRHTANTREDIARNYVTRVDLHNDLDQLIKRFDRIEEKIDRLVENR
jgi:hypothetical protein